MEKSNLKDKFKLFFSRFTWFQLTLLFVGIIAVITMSIIVKSSAITVIYSIFGIIYTILLAAKFKVSLLFGLIQVSFYIAQSVIYKNWGEVILNCAIVLPILIASTVTWFTGIDKKNEKVTKSEIKPWEWALIAGIFVAANLSFYFILDALNTQNTIIACFSCAFTACAHYLLLRKSQWMFVAFIGVNTFLFVLWLLPIIQVGELTIESMPMLVTMVVYNISNIMGIVNWTRQNKNKVEINDNENKQELDIKNMNEMDENKD